MKENRLGTDLHTLGHIVLCISVYIYNQNSASGTCLLITEGSCENVHLYLVGLAWCLRFCSSNQLPGVSKSAGSWAILGIAEV